MTKREKILAYLADNGMDVSRIREDHRWEKPGTIVVSFLPTDLWRRLYFDLFKDMAPEDRKIDIHQIRAHFEWQEAYRISWVGD